MAVNQIPHKRIALLIKPALQIPKILYEPAHTDFFIRNQIYQIKIKRIIHDRIPFIPFKEIPCVVPYFSNYQRILLHCLDCPSEALPEKMADFIPYIHSPSVDITFLNPIAGNVRDEFLNLRIFQIKLRHSTVISKAFEVRKLPRFISKRKIIDKIPVTIFRFLSLFQNIRKCKKFSSRMVEYSIHNHLHSTLMCLLYKLPQLLFCSKRRVNTVVINGIVLMAGVRFENRCHI